MSKKLYIILILIIVGLGILFVSSQFLKKQDVGLANPASVFCVDNGGHLSMRTDSTGGQFGVCVFDNNTECEEWMYFRGQCKMGEVKNDIPIKQETVAALNQRIFNNGIYITPLAVVSDSRCPSGVQCIWAGEITIKIKLEKGIVSKEVNLGETKNVIFEGSQVFFESASFGKTEYSFAFKVVPITADAPKGKVEGRVTLSPTCPVERMPPDPNCAPKPYATSIDILKTGSSSVVTSIQSDASGAFNVSLDAGSYTLHAGGGKMLPRCTDVSVEVKNGQIIIADISCDTGIR